MTLVIAAAAVIVFAVVIVVLVPAAAAAVVETVEKTNVTDAWKKVIIWTKLRPILSVLCVDWLFGKTCCCC